MNVFVLIYLKTWTYFKTQHDSTFNSGLNSIVKKRFIIWVDSIKFPRALPYTLVPQKFHVLFPNYPCELFGGMTTRPTELTTFVGGMGMEYARSIVQNNLKGNLWEAKLLLVWVSLPTSSMGFHFHTYAHDIHPHTPIFPRANCCCH